MVLGSSGESDEDDVAADRGGIEWQAWVLGAESGAWGSLQQGTLGTGYLHMYLGRQVVVST